jgi:hypothetical protein
MVERQCRGEWLDAMKLVETMVACVIFAFVSLEAYVPLRSVSSAGFAAQSTLASALAAARALAATTEDGATITVAPDATGSKIAFWLHRPIGAAQLIAAHAPAPLTTSVPLTLVRDGTADSTFVVYVSTAGTVAAAAGTAASRPSREPLCDASGAYTIAVESSRSLPARLECRSGAVTVSR